MTTNAQLAALLSESYKEIEDLKRVRKSPAQDELREILAQLDDARARLVRLISGGGEHRHETQTQTAAGVKRARTSTDDSTSPPASKKHNAYPSINGHPPPHPPPQPRAIHLSSQHHLPSHSHSHSHSPTRTTTTTTTTNPLPTPPTTTTTTPYPATNALGQRICRTCGQPGRYKDSKCVEKWGPGPLGPGTVCDRCRKKIKRVERRATATQKPVVPQLARNNLPVGLLSSPEGEGDAEGEGEGDGEGEVDEEMDELYGDGEGEEDAGEGGEGERIKAEDVVDELLDAVDASEGR